MKKHIIIIGKVQGVGFRYWLQSIAVKKNIFGWVKNKIAGDFKNIPALDEFAKDAADITLKQDMSVRWMTNARTGMYRSASMNSTRHGTSKPTQGFFEWRIGEKINEGIDESLKTSDAKVYKQLKAAQKNWKDNVWHRWRTGLGLEYTGVDPSKELKLFNNEVKKNLNSNTDIIITSGAVSAGKFDFIPSIIKNYKLISIFKDVKIRPGKPIMFAKFQNNTCFFGLPGNPISTAACFRFFVLPLLFKSLGLESEKPIIARLKNNFSKKKDFTRFIKGRIIFSQKGFAEFEVFKGQESYKIKPFTKSNAWGVFKDGISKFKKNQYIECYSSSGFNEFLIN